jgi:CRISPR-associated protein Cmr5
MALNTNTQKMAQAAYQRIAERLKRLNESERDKYTSFARSFPSLIHACGLAQAAAFAGAKYREQYLEDLAVVLKAIGHSEAASADSLGRAIREQFVPAYVRLSRNALQAASWLKRYVEAAEEPK